MRYVLLLFFVFLTGLGFSQRIQIEGVEVNYSSHYPDGPLYVIRQTQAGAVPEGQVCREEIIGNSAGLTRVPLRPLFRMRILPA